MAEISEFDHEFLTTGDPHVEEEKLKNVVCPPIKYNFKEPSKLDK